MLKKSVAAYAFTVLTLSLLLAHNSFAQSEREPDMTITGEGRAQRMTEIWNILPVDLNMELCQRNPETITGVISKLDLTRDRAIEGFVLREANGGRTSIMLDENLYNRLCIACLGHFYNLVKVGKRVTVEAYACGTGQILWANRIREAGGQNNSRRRARRRN